MEATTELRKFGAKDILEQDIGTWVTIRKGRQLLVSRVGLAQMIGILRGLPDLAGLIEGNSKDRKPVNGPDLERQVDDLIVTCCMDPRFVMGVTPTNGALAVGLIEAVDKLEIYTAILNNSGFSQEKAEEIRPL